MVSLAASALQDRRGPTKAANEHVGGVVPQCSQFCLRARYHLSACDDSHDDYVATPTGMYVRVTAT